MISCTDFIPFYSELFTYVESKHGRHEVDRFWAYLFAPDGNGIPLINFIKAEGIRGCYSYWSGTLNEEAADFTMYLNEKAGWFMNVMHRCPSKGRLLALQNQIGITPYHDYCLHCDSYRLAVEKAGLKYIYNFTDVEHAACSMLIYDPKVFDGRINVDAHTEIMERKASQNQYFHRDFHSSLNMCVEYLGSHYGNDELETCLRQYTLHVYQKQIQRIRKEGLNALKDQIMQTYAMERAEDAVVLTLSGKKLYVTVLFCPAVKHLLCTGRIVSKWYSETTRIVMQTIAAESGLQFEMNEYNMQTGAAQYSFTAQG